MGPFWIVPLQSQTRSQNQQIYLKCSDRDHSFYGLFEQGRAYCSHRLSQKDLFVIVYFFVRCKPILLVVQR